MDISLNLINSAGGEEHFQFHDSMQLQESEPFKNAVIEFDQILSEENINLEAILNSICPSEDNNAVQNVGDLIFDLVASSQKSVGTRGEKIFSILGDSENISPAEMLTVQLEASFFSLECNMFSITADKVSNGFQMLIKNQ